MKKKRNLTGVSDILAGLKQETTLGRNLKHAEIWKHWEEIVGTELALHGRPRAVKDQQLRVEVDSAAWMHKFSYLKWPIIKKVNGFAKENLISDVFFVLLGDDESLDDE